MRRAWWGGLTGLLLAMPAGAACFEGKPGKVTYDNGREITIIQRHGSDLTYTQPYAGYQDSVNKTHLMLFPKTARRGARATEFRWTTRLPKLDQLVPFYHFNLKGTMTSGDGKAVPYRNEGDVLAREVVQIGACSYDVLVVKTTAYLNEQVISVATDYLSPQMLVLLRSDIALVSAGKNISQTAVAIE